MSDPLVISPLSFLLTEYEECEEPAPFLLPLAPDLYHKHNISGGCPDGIRVPSRRADAIYTGWDDYFVRYLRRSFHWGGFAAWADRKDQAPEQLHELAKGLLPI
jgi:hypothetical protein